MEVPVKDTWVSLLVSAVGLLLAATGSYLFLTDPAKYPEHPAILPIALMLVGGMVYVLSGLFKQKRGG